MRCELEKTKRPRVVLQRTVGTGLEGAKAQAKTRAGGKRMERKSQAHAGTIYRARPAGVDWPVRLRPPADQSSPQQRSSDPLSSRTGPVARAISRALLPAVCSPPTGEHASGLHVYSRLLPSSNALSQNMLAVRSRVILCSSSQSTSTVLRARA